MPTRGVIRTEVRYHLGEYTAGTWEDDALNYFIQQACNEHSQRAWSNKVVRFTSGIRGVQDYRFSPDFGQLCSIRYYDVDGSDRELDYTAKSVLRDYGFRGTELGRPCAYYREQDSYGLFPIPDKKIILECKFEGSCPHYTPVIVNRSTSPIEMYRSDFTVQIVNDETVTNGGLDPACIYVGMIGVYLRRKGTYYPGNLKMTLENVESGYVHESVEVPADTINPRPDWQIFDFTENPLEIYTDEIKYIMRLQGDSEYQDADPSVYGGGGVEIGTEEEHENPYIEFHRLRNDIEIEYYRNVCDPLIKDDQELEIPQRYHHTIVKMVVSKAYGQNNYNLPASREWKADADADIMEAKAQAIIPTLGRRLEIRSSGRLNPNMQYLGDGKFSLRFGNILGG